jgi:hypothetical protein
MSNAVIGKTEYGVSSIVADPARSIVLTKSFAGNSGVIKAGTLVGKGADDKFIPFEFPKSLALGTANGTLTAFSGALGVTQPGSIGVSAGDVTAIDDGFGNIGGEGVSGTINYLTGAISVEFETAPTSGTEVSVAYGSKLSGVLVRDIDLTRESEAPVLVFGLVSKKDLITGANPASEADVKRLESIFIYGV